MVDFFVPSPPVVLSRYFLTENSALPVKWLLSSMLRRWASTVSEFLSSFLCVKSNDEIHKKLQGLKTRL